MAGFVISWYGFSLMLENHVLNTLHIARYPWLPDQPLDLYQVTPWTKQFSYVKL